MSAQRLPTVLVCLALLRFADPGEAQSPEPFPELPPGERAAVDESLDGPHFDDLRRFFRSFESRSGAEFFAAIVESTSRDGSLGADADGSDTVAYADALYQDWLPGGRLDADRHVLIVISLLDRGIAVHPGIRWADLGFERQAITRAIDESRFGDLARGGDYDRALIALAEDLDERLAGLEGRARPPSPRPAAGSGAASVSGWSVFLWGGLAVAVVLAALRLRRRRRAWRRLEEEVGRWKTKLATAAERLLDLEHRHSLYFAAGSRRWSGQSQSLDQECADAVNQLYLLYSEAVELLEQTEGRFAEIGSFGLRTRALDEVWGLLRHSPVRFETGEAENRRRIFLPLTRQYEGTAMTLLDDLDRIYGEAASLLEQIDRIESLHREATDHAKRASSEALAACNLRGDLGLPTAPLLAELERAVGIEREGERLLGDPIRAVEVLDRAEKLFARLAERARLGNEAIEKVRGPVAEMGLRLRSEIRRLREAGIRPEEPGFQPDVELDRGSREAVEIEQLVAAGEEGRAKELLDSLDEAMKGLGERLCAIEQAREGVPAALAELESETQDLRKRLPEARGALERLFEEHSPDAFAEASDNLEELDRLLEEVDRWTAKIRDDHAEQRYLSALAALDECEEVIRAGVGLVDEIDQAETALAAARERSRGLVREDRRLLAEIGRLRGEPGAGRDLASRASERAAEIERLLGETDEPRPNWLALETELAASRNDLDGLRATLEEELAAYRRSRALEKDLEERLRGLERQVDEEYRDRPHVARQVAEASAELRTWKDEIADGGRGGRALLASGESLAASLARAENAWRSEMELVRTAETELNAARAELGRAERSHYGYGVTSDCREARALVADAETEARNQRWEDVLSKAGQARRRIDEEVASCRRRAQALEEEARRRTESLRRQRMWEQVSQATVVTASAEGAAASRSAGPRLPRRGPSVGPSFGSTFSSRGGGRTSGGSSFGGTRSGGSKW